MNPAPFPHSTALLELLHLGVVFHTPDGQITACNGAAEKILGLTIDQMRGVTSVDPRWRAIHEDGSAFAGQDHPAMVALRTGQAVSDVVMGVFNPQAEATRWIKILATPILDAPGAAVHGVYAVFEDITETIVAKQAQNASEARFHALFSAMSEGMALHRLVYDQEGRPCDYLILDANPAFERQTGMQRSSVVGKLASQAYGTGTAPFLDIYAKVAQGGPALQFEQPFAPLQKYFLINVFSPGPDQFATVFEDITTRKHAEEDLQATLLEKEALLKEVHHRVKNNLQVIASLLRMEARRSDHSATRSVLKGMQDRIHSMALLHEAIYRSANFASIDLGDYLARIANQMFSTLQTLPTPIALRLELDSVPTSLEQATPCGLLVSELLANALKHAFPDGRHGTVCLELKPGAQAGWRLCVSDNGVGLGPDFESRRHQSLGLQLVESLASQMGGTLHIGPGSAFSVEFHADAAPAVAAPVP